MFVIVIIIFFINDLWYVTTVFLSLYRRKMFLKKFHPFRDHSHQRKNNRFCNFYKHCDISHVIPCILLVMGASQLNMKRIRLFCKRCLLRGFQMLNCILSMVEKTKKALGILQERGLTDANFPDWNRKKSTEEVLAQTVRHAEERIESIRKKAGKN